MRKSQNIKVKNYTSAGSGLLLFLLTFLMINPVSGVAFAEEVDVSADESGELDVQSEDGIEAYAATASTVNIAFNPTSANGTVTPVDASGAKAKVDVTATVRVQNSGGYNVYVGSSSSQLKNGSNVIDSVTSSTTYENMPLNRWGYSFAQGTTASNTYNAMPATLRGTALYSNSSTSIKDETKTYTLSFAANISADKPAGTYTNQVTMSVVSSPLEVVNDFGITTMQEMTSAICNAATDNDSDGQISAQLEDIRDGKYYWVSKLADGKCWMTQNLDLDLNNGADANKAKTLPLTSETSDLGYSNGSYPELANKVEWTPMNGGTVLNSETSVTTSSFLADDLSQQSWDFGAYYITTPEGSGSSSCRGSNLTNCTAEQFTAYDETELIKEASNRTEAHYIIGNFYQWNAATAGTGGSMTSGQAAGSVCPRGWRLPTGGDSGDFQALMTAAGIGVSANDMLAMVAAPYYFVLGGRISSTNLFYDGNKEADYWSSTPRSTSNAYYYDLRRSGIFPSHNSYSKQFGFSVRCIAR